MKITKIVVLAVVSLAIAGTSFADQLKFFTYINGHAVYRFVDTPRSSIANYPNHVVTQYQAGTPEKFKYVYVNGHWVARHVEN